MNYLKRIGRLVAICICAVCVGIIPICLLYTSYPGDTYADEFYEWAEQYDADEAIVISVSYTHLDVYKRQTEMNDNKSNQIVSADENRSDGDNRSEDYQAYENLVKETIDYESLEVTHHDDMRQVDEIVNLIVETVMCKNDKILIASNWYPASLVKKKFLMLTYSHIELSLIHI